MWHVFDVVYNWVFTTSLFLILMETKKSWQSKYSKSLNLSYLFNDLFCVAIYSITMNQLANRKSKTFYRGKMSFNNLFIGKMFFNNLFIGKMFFNHLFIGKVFLNLVLRQMCQN